MSKTPSNTKIAITHHDQTTTVEFNSWDTSIDEIIEGFKTLLIGSRFDTNLIEQYFNDEI